MRMSVGNFTTNLENIRQNSPEWVTEKIKTELSSLQKEMFYTVKDDGQVECDMDTVKSYLESIKDLERGVIKEKGSAWVMAVQIALESIKDENGNPKYDVGVIDGQFGRNTRNAVRKFQEDCGFTGKDLDGYPGQMTIGKLLEKLGGVVGSQNRLGEMGGKKVIIKAMSSVSELPDGYEWKDPEGYDKSKEETYPTIYSMGGYWFYSNGRCKTPEGKMEYTKNVVEALGESNSDTGNKGEDGPLDKGEKTKETKTYKNGDVYEGDMVNGVPEGQGIYKWKDVNLRYEGGWKNGKQDGVGMMVYSNGVRVPGMWSNGKIQECNSYGCHLKVDYWFAGTTPCLTLNNNYLMFPKEAHDAVVVYTMDLVNYIISCIGSAKKSHLKFVVKGNKLEVKGGEKKCDVENVSEKTGGYISAQHFAEWLNKGFGIQ